MQPEHFGLRQSGRGKNFGGGCSETGGPDVYIGRDTMSGASLSMTCGESRKRLDSASTAAEFRDLSGEAAVRQHLAGCPACRREFAGAARLWQWVEDSVRLAQRLPAQAVEEGRNRVSAAVLWGHRSRLPSRVLPWPSGRGWAWGLGAAAAAGVLIVGIAALLLLPGRPSPCVVAVRPPVAKPVPVLARKAEPGQPGKAKPDRRRPVEPSPFADLAAMSASQAAGHIRQLCYTQSHSAQGLTPGLAARIEYVLANHALSDRDRLSLLQCLMPAQAVTGNLEGEQDTLVTWADLSDRVDGHARTASSILSLARDAGTGQRDWRRALPMADLVLTRYANLSEVRADALCVVGEFYASTGKLAQAAETYGMLVQEQPPGSQFFDRGVREKAAALVNLGKAEDAVAFLLEMRKTTPDPAQQAGYMLRAGLFSLHAGKRPRALELFDQVAAEFPGTPASRDALSMRDQLKRAITRELSLN